MRNSPTHPYVQVSGDVMGRSCTPDLNSPTVRTHDRHSTKSPVDDDDNFRISVDVSRCQTSNVPTTSDVSHDGCTPQDVIHEGGLGKLGEKCDASQTPINVSRLNTCEGQTDIYCANEFVKHSMTNGMNTGRDQTCSNAHSIVNF